MHGEILHDSHHGERLILRSDRSFNFDSWGITHIYFVSIFGH
jgi:hypothetical protein